MDAQLPIFFLTDFGLKDPYVGIMKAVALTVGATGPLIDLTHGVPPQDLLAGALALEDALPWLPERCVVCAVVDPGVGSERRPVAVQRGGRFFVAPDNGLLSAVYVTGDYMLRGIAPGGPIAPERSATFHGRDVFAPAAALLATGKRRFEEIGPAVYFPTKLELPPLAVAEDGSLEITIIAADHFGNLATNLRRSQIPKGIDIRAGHFLLEGKDVGSLKHTYSDVAVGHPLVYFNHSDRLEVSISMGSAAKEFGLSRGARLTFRPVRRA